MSLPYERPKITTMDGREVLECLGPAQASTSGGPPGPGIGGNPLNPPFIPSGGGASDFGRG